MRCKQTNRIPVVTEWQDEVPCPQCQHYRQGSCVNPCRDHALAPCPFDGVPLGDFVAIGLSDETEAPKAAPASALAP